MGDDRPGTIQTMGIQVVKEDGGQSTEERERFIGAFNKGWPL